MSNLTDLLDDVRDQLKQFISKSFDIIKANYPSIRTIIIQYNDGQIFIGKDTSGTYDSKYYNTLAGQQDQKIEQLVNDYRDCILECKNCIDDTYQGNRMKSFNVFYNDHKKTINVCKNQIGNKSMAKSRLFNEFTLL